MKFLAFPDADQSITPSIVRTLLDKWPSMAVLRVSAHANFNLDLCPVVHVGVLKEIQAIPKRNKIFYTKDIENDPLWFVKVVDELPEHVYFTISSGALPDDAVINLSREVNHRRNIVAIESQESDLMSRMLEVIFK